jgi:hypothetical protein
MGKTVNRQKVNNQINDVLEKNYLSKQKAGIVSNRLRQKNKNNFKWILQNRNWKKN